MAKDKLRTGVIGLGFMGELHARVHDESAAIELLAVADTNTEAAEPIAERLGVKLYSDYNALLGREDIDAVSICMPDRYHVEPAVAAAKTGKAILLEKPMAHDAEAAAAIAAAVDHAGARLMVGHILRFDPRYVQLRAAAAPELLGDVIHMRAKRNTVRAVAERLGSASSILFYLGVHDVDMMQWVCRSRITRVYAQKVEKLGNGNEDALYAVINFDNGAIGILDYSWSWPTGLPAGYYAAFEVVGTKTATYLDVRDQGFATISATGLTGSDTHLWPEINGRIVGDLRDEIGHFAEAVLDGEPFAQPYQDALAAIRVLDALFESVRTDAPVNVVH